MFEVGTGLAAAEIKSIFNIEKMSFSSDGRHLALGSSKGTVSIYSVGDHIFQNMKQVIDAMVIENDFWSNYPIFLADYGDIQTGQE